MSCSRWGFQPGLQITTTYSQTFPKTSIGVEKFTLRGVSFHFTFLREKPNEYSLRGDYCDRKRYFYFMAQLFEEEAGGHRSEVLVVGGLTVIFFTILGIIEL